MSQPTAAEAHVCVRSGRECKSTLKRNGHGESASSALSHRHVADFEYDVFAYLPKSCECWSQEDWVLVCARFGCNNMEITTCYKYLSCPSHKLFIAKDMVWGLVTMRMSNPVLCVVPLTLWSLCFQLLMYLPTQRSRTRRTRSGWPS